MSAECIAKFCSDTLGYRVKLSNKDDSPSKILLPLVGRKSTNFAGLVSHVVVKRTAEYIENFKFCYHIVMIKLDSIFDKFDYFKNNSLNLSPSNRPSKMYYLLHSIIDLLKLIKIPLVLQYPQDYTVFKKSSICCGVRE